MLDIMALFKPAKKTRKTAYHVAVYLFIKSYFKDF